MVQSPSLFQQLLAVWRELPGLVSDRVDLLGLELQCASLALIQIVVLVLACGILGVTAWLVLWAGLIVGLVALGLHIAWALLVVLVFNAGAAWWAMGRIRQLLQRLSLPATRRHLGRRSSPDLHGDVSEAQPAAQASDDSGPTLADLETRAEQAEMQLVARQDRLRNQLTVLRDDVRVTLRPQTLLALAAAGVGSLLSLWWLARRRRPLLQLGSAGGSARLPWLRWVGLAGPLWPLVRKLLSHMPAGSAPMIRPGVAPLLAGKPLEASRWAGRWLDVAATPARQASQSPVAVDVHYLLRQDGSFDVVRRSIDGRGRQRTVRGRAHPVAASGGAEMRLCLWPAWLRPLPLAWDEHNVLHVDDEYTAALVGPRGGARLALLLREGSGKGASLETRFDALLRLARDRGYAVDRLRFTGVVHAGS